MLLAVETSTDRISAAVHDGHGVIASLQIDGARRHTEQLVPLVAQTLDDAGLDQAALTSVAVGTGPGAFTGMRVGIATAQAFAWARSLPLVGVCSLDAIAAEAWAQGVVAPDSPLIVAVDARRREVFWARYDAGARSSDPVATAPSELDDSDRAGIALIGDAVERVAGVAEARASRGVLARGWSPSARGIALIATGSAPGRLATIAPTPIYVRRPDAIEPTARKPVMPPTGHS